MTIDDLPPAEDQRFWSLYARHSLESLERADQNGVAFWEMFQMPRATGEYAMRAIREIRKSLDAETPSRRRLALRQAATCFHKHRGWRAEIPGLALHFENAMLALAAEQVASKRGNPARTLSSSRIPERDYVNRAVKELIDLADSQGRPDWIAELWKPGTANKASRGRKLIFDHALRLAKKDSVTLCEKTLRVQIREHAKVAATYINYLALLLQKAAKKERRNCRPLIKAAGT
jgi:hypothetical protein